MTGWNGSGIILLSMRGRAVAARRAHNPEVSGSNPLPATFHEPESFGLWFFVNPEVSGRKIFPTGGFFYEPQTAGLVNFKIN